jgi:hypothetical protein
MDIDAIFDNPNITYDVINKYNEYFSKLKDTYDEDPTEDDLHDVLEKFSKYLLNISFINNNIYLRIVLLDRDGIERINDIKLNLIHLINYTYYVSDMLKDLTTELKLKISEIICNAVFTIYQYFYVHIHSEKLEFKIKSFRPNLSQSRRSAKTLGGTIIDIENINVIKSLINNMLTRNSARFNNKLNDFIIARIKEIEENKQDSYYIFLHSRIDRKKESIDSAKDNILIKNISILYYITIIEFNKQFYDIHDDTILLYPMNKTFFYLHKDDRYIKTERKLKFKSGDRNAIELLRDERLLKDNHILILRLKGILSHGLRLILDVSDLLIIKKDTFITIPQYGPICWFISMLTCITYSDRNKKLLLTKKIINEQNIKDIKDHQYDSKIIFVSFIYYIIDTITSKFKTYSKLTDDCELFKILKETPTLFLKKLIGEYRDSLLAEIDKNFEDKLIKDKNKYSLVRSFLNSIFLSEPKTEKHNTYKKREKILKNMCKDKIEDNYACASNFIYRKIYYNETDKLNIHQHNYSIIKLFYSFLNINCLYVYKINNNLYKLLEDDDDDDDDIDQDNHDVIIIDYSNSINNDDLLKKNILRNTMNITADIIYIEDKNIRYRGEIYEIDYVLHSTDNNETCKTCGHCVSNIHYKNEEYYYNSIDTVTSINCSQDEIEIPCSLIRQTWKEKIDTDQCYKLPKCNYVREYRHKKLSQNVKEIFADSSYDKMCFSRDKDIQICYVKQSLLGGNKKRKSVK